MALIKHTTAAHLEEDAPLRKTLSDRNCAELAEQMLHPSAETRRWAARDLIDCPGSSSTLVTRLDFEQDASVREVIFTSLTRLGDATAVQGLVQCMRSEDAALRNEAIEAMKQLPQAVAPIMCNLLCDADSDMRIFAVNILESLRHPKVEQWLIEVIERDAHVNVCATAVDLLGEVGSPAALEPLKRLKVRFAPETYIQFAANLAIKRILED
jgi:HEAT repeat protein